MKRILLCGSNGLLGQRLALMLGGGTKFEVLNTSHHRSFLLEPRLFDYTQLDITKKGDVKSLASSFQPDVIINTAGATNVDWCESHRDEAWKANVVGVENLIEAARKARSKLIHVSTDYVFDGRHGPYKEDDAPNPISYYGKTKLAAENAIRIAGIPFTIVRTIVLYGNTLGMRKNFALWVLESLQSHQKIRCAVDQIGNPTFVGDLACAVLRIFELEREGLYHICGSETVSRFDFAKNVANVFHLDASLIQPVKTSELMQPAPRPPVTGFVTAKAEEELGWKPMDTTQGLTKLKQELLDDRKN